MSNSKISKKQRISEIIDFCYSEDCWVFYAAEYLGYTVADAQAALDKINNATAENVG